MIGLRDFNTVKQKALLKNKNFVLRLIVLEAYSILNNLHALSNLVIRNILIE